MEILLDNLKAEVYSDVQAYKYKDVRPKELDYDEIFEDDDG